MIIKVLARDGSEIRSFDLGDLPKDVPEALEFVADMEAEGVLSVPPGVTTRYSVLDQNGDELVAYNLRWQAFQTLREWESGGEARGQVRDNVTGELSVTGR